MCSIAKHTFYSVRLVKVHKGREPISAAAWPHNLRPATTYKLSYKYCFYDLCLRPAAES